MAFATGLWFIHKAFPVIVMPLGLQKNVRRATVIWIGWDASGRGYRIRFGFGAYNLRRVDEWSTIQTDPPMDIRGTRWIGKTVEVMTPDRPPWRLDDEVMLTLEPY